MGLVDANPNNNILLYSKGNYIQFPGIEHDGKLYIFQKNAYICMTEIGTLQINYNFKFFN